MYFLNYLEEKRNLRVFTDEMSDQSAESSI